MKKYLKGNIFCGIVLPTHIYQNLILNLHLMSVKMLHIIYADIESLIKYKNNSEKSLTIKLAKHIPCRYSMSTIWGFDHVENKQFISQKKLYDKVLLV